ncbi:MAG: hypothetical protein JSS86_13840 [Cyanobacteria bacterium SZAS LIN-2]|nr:hypothetical protein [Cyanobacteria bacterium SZAS LIN-2]
MAIVWLCCTPAALCQNENTTRPPGDLRGIHGLSIEIEKLPADLLREGVSEAELKDAAVNAITVEPIKVLGSDAPFKLLISAKKQTPWTPLGSTLIKVHLAVFEKANQAQSFIPSTPLWQVEESREVDTVASKIAIKRALDSGLKKFARALAMANAGDHGNKYQQSFEPGTLRSTRTTENDRKRFDDLLRIYSGPPGKKPLPVSPSK